MFLEAMTRRITIALLAMMPMIASAQEIIYSKNDSIAIEKILQQHSTAEYGSKGELTLAIALEFIGKDYIANTLENGTEEPLFISCDRLDCSTFVELATAISMSASQDGNHFDDVCSNLEKLRYRGGKREGYASRLHYTSWWIADNIEKGLIEEVTCETEHCTRILELNFMSTHPDSYLLLKGDTAMQARIAELEKPFRGVATNYIPKAKLNCGKEVLNIRDGDIIALVTTIKGLDISHVGFAYWKGNSLHMLHASSAQSKVIKDTQTLFDYQKNKSKQIGIRVLRLK